MEKFITLHRENLKALKRLSAKVAFKVSDKQIKIHIEIPFYESEFHDRKVHTDSARRARGVWKKLIS